jgi:hypothetical protein
MNSPYKEAHFKLDRAPALVRELVGIGRRLGLAQGTVKDQLNRIYRELGIANRNSACGHTHGRSYQD